jgi:protocatechuate 3,4-dioxygenase beta subunit
MVSSSRQAIACILLILSASIYARSQSAATITGKVTVKDKGIAGVGVSLNLADPNRPSTTRYRAVTDDLGNYRLTNVPPGTYTVMIAAPGFATVGSLGDQKNVIVNKSETIENVDFALVRGGVITGKVTDVDGNPLIEEDVYIMPALTQERRVYYGMGNGRTDDRGIYRVFGLHPGSYKVAAGQDEQSGFGRMRDKAAYRRTYYPEATEASAATVIELKEGGEVSNIDITVGRALVKYSASGRIVDETGRPLADIPYGIQMFVDQNSTSSMTTGAVSSKEGEFKLNSLSPGKYAVFIQTPPNSDWRADPVQFEITDRNVTGLTVTTSKGASASGVIVVEGTNDKTLFANLIKGRLFAQVLNDRPNSGMSPSTSINTDGTFRVSGLQGGLLSFGIYPEGRLKIVRIERDGVAYVRGVEIKESEQVTGLRVIAGYANGTIRGVVKLEKGTLPPDGHFGVSLRRLGENDPGPYISYSGDQPQVDARGQFISEGLLPGTYEVSVMYAPDMRTPWRATKQQVVVTNGAVTNVTITIDPDAPPTRP